MNAWINDLAGFRKGEKKAHMNSYAPFLLLQSLTVASDVYGLPLERHVFTSA